MLMIMSKSRLLGQHSLKKLLPDIQFLKKENVSDSGAKDVDCRIVGVLSGVRTKGETLKPNSQTWAKSCIYL